MHTFDSMEDLVSFCWEYLDSKDSKACSGSAEAVNQLWPSLCISSALLTALAKEALAKRVGEMSRDTKSYTQRARIVQATLIENAGATTPKAVPVEFVYASPKPREIYVQILSTRYSVANGESKKLIHFTREDFAYVMEGHQKQIRGLMDIQAALEHGQKLLDKYQVTTVEELPKEVLEDYANQWAEVKGGKSSDGEAAD